MPASEDLARRLADELDGGAGLTEEARQRLFAALIRLYARGRADGESAPFAGGSVPVEDVVLTAAEMLRAAEVTSFELAALFDI